MRRVDEAPLIKEFHRRLDALYKSCSCPTCVQLADNSKSNMPKLPRKHWAKATKHLHTKGELTPAMMGDKPIVELTQAINKVLAHAVSTGLADNTVPPVLLQKLQNDVYLFSGFKGYTELKLASQLLLTEQGQRKPYEQYKADILKIDEKYNQQYLEAEYLYANRAAVGAAKWAELTKDGDGFNLQYRTAGDNRVRAEHDALRDITLPPSDPFWNSYYPPNGWRCRCVAIQVRKEKYPTSKSAEAIAKGELATTAIDKNGNNALEIFRYNPGKQGVIFPPKHPYKGDLSKCGTQLSAGGQAEKCKVNEVLQGQLITKAAADVMAKRNIIFDKPLKQQYKTEFIDKKTKGAVQIHELVVRSKEDFKDVFETAKAWAKKGKTALMPPEINVKEIAARAKVLKGLDNVRSNPDLFILETETYMDLKRPETYSNVIKNANKAVKQGCEAIISDKHFKITDKNINDLTREIFNDTYYTKNNVHFKVNGVIVSKSRTADK